jgi:hypothetical protein
MKKGSRKTWLLNIILLLILITIFGIVDMSGKILGYDALLTYLVLGIVLILGIAVNAFRLIKGFKLRWVSYVLIIFYVFAIIPFFVEAHPDDERVLMIILKKYIWTEEEGIPKEIPASLNEIQFHIKIKELSKSQLDKFSDNPIIVYNPNGLKNKTWIAYCKNSDLKTFFSGNVVLWYDGQINRRKNISDKGTKKDELRYYIFK